TSAISTAGASTSWEVNSTSSEPRVTLASGADASGAERGGSGANSISPNSPPCPACSSSTAEGLAPRDGLWPNISVESSMPGKLGCVVEIVMRAYDVREFRSRVTRCHPLWLLPSGPDQVGGRERPPDSRRRYGRNNRVWQAAKPVKL